MVTNKNSDFAFILEPKEVDKAAEHVADILSGFHFEKKAVVRIRLLI